jgi:hypothetical protein
MPVEVRWDEVPEEELPAVDYRWDADTEILAAALRPNGVGEGLSGSVDIEGTDGSWLMLEVMAGRLAAVEVAVWPEVSTVKVLETPRGPGAARLKVPSGDGAGDGAATGEHALEVSLPIRAVADEAESTIHFRIGPQRGARVLRVAKDLLVEVDARSRLAGLWLLNVPPFPSSSPP